MKLETIMDEISERALIRTEDMQFSLISIFLRNSKSLFQYLHEIFFSPLNDFFFNAILVRALGKLALKLSSHYRALGIRDRRVHRCCYLIDWDQCLCEGESHRKVSANS